jgi:hypothetical protein
MCGPKQGEFALLALEGRARVGKFFQKGVIWGKAVATVVGGVVPIAAEEGLAARLTEKQFEDAGTAVRAARLRLGEKASDGTT